MSDQPTLLQSARDSFEPIRVDEELKAKALRNLERWLTAPGFEGTRPQLERMIERGDGSALFDAFFQTIPFGTGGRRGPVGFGTNRINTHTISTSIQGHCEFLGKHRPESEPSVVIAYDVRCFRDLRRTYDPELPNPLLGTTSRDFARLAAQVYAANGVRVWFPSPETGSYVSTPELSFAIRQLGASGGLNISASHNHPDDNGAKIYNHHGAQEIPPLDEEMAEIVESIQTAQSTDWDQAVDDGLIRWIPADVHDEYVATNLRVTLRPEARSARVVFSPLHGTGWSSVGAVLREAGFRVEQVPDQSTPDGSFPNVPFRSPNPEVPESLSAATEHAREQGADLVLAADPDADRLGLCVPDRERRWVFLNGNQIGTVLAAYVMEERARSGRPDGFAVTTVVTTSLFRRIAASYGVRTVDDLGIGFKYISDVLNTIEAKGRYRDIEARLEDFVLGIEESHGYLVSPEIRDKDAAGAGLLLAELASRLAGEGQTVPGYLDDVYRRFGYVRNTLRSTVMQGARGYINIRHIQESLRKEPPERVGDLRLLRFTDRWDESGPLGPIVSSTDRAARDLLTFELEGDARIILRPSGTESKNKCYVEVGSEPLGEGAPAEDLARRKAQVDERAGRVAEDFVLLMLSRIGVDMPRWGLAVSDLVPLEWKQDFTSSLLPELVERLRGGAAAGSVEGWLDERLSSYGADGRLLVRNAVARYVEDEHPSREVRDVLAELFDLR